MTKKYKAVAVGGTFDHLHKGHRALLSKAFESGEKVLIGITSDDFAERMSKKLDNNLSARMNGLKAYLEASYPGRIYAIRVLSDYFGEGVYEEEVGALVASRETVGRVSLANEVRRAKGLKPLETVVVETVLAEDDRPMSSTRIRLGEIDEEGTRTFTKRKRIRR